MSAKPKYSAALNNEVGTSDFIPYSSHVTQDIIKLGSGDYIKILRLQGATHESADIQDINIWHEQLNHFMRNIASPHVAVWSHVVRRGYGEYPGGDFMPGFCREFNEKYKGSVSGRRMLVNELYLSIVYRPQPVKFNRFIELFGQKEHERREKQLEEIESINDLGGAALSSLDRYEPEMLGCYEHNGFMFSEMLEFLAFLVDGEWRRFPLPRAEINETLCTSRPFFGKGGLMALSGPTRTQYAGILAIQDYPANTSPGILNGLLSLPFEFVLTQSFTFLSKANALGRMTRQQARMVNAGDVAETQIADISAALDDLVSNRFVMGAHSLSLLVYAEDQKGLNENINAAGSALSHVGIKYAREEAGIAGSFYAQLPGNFSYRVRVGDITSRNFAGFSAFHNYPIGQIRGNQWGDAVMMFATTSGSPYYFNFHRNEGRQSHLDLNHRDLANTMVIGQSGSGKTVLEMALLAMSQKFNQPATPASYVLFDKDLGASIGVRAMGGKYYTVKNGVPSGFAPFQMDATPANLFFLEALVKKLVHRDSLPLTPTQEREISQAVAGVMGAPKARRRLGSILEFLDSTDPNGLHPRLARWCRGGPLYWLFDNLEYTLSLEGSFLKPSATNLGGM